MQQISLAITTYNRYDLTIKSFEKVIGDERISDIVIVDDSSTNGDGYRLKEYFKDNPKVHVYINNENLNMSRNKFYAIGICESDMVLIGDSDNVFSIDYIDALFKLGIFNDPTVINMPQFAKENFDFRKYAGYKITKHNAKQFMEDPMFRCMLNCCNYVVPRNSYLENYVYNEDIKGADTIWFNYNWLKNDNTIYIVPRMEYTHTVGSHSGFLENVNINMKHAIELEKKILEL